MRFNAFCDILLKSIEPANVSGIYFLQQSTGYIKIGQAYRIRDRIVGYKTHNPLPLWFIGYIPTGELDKTEKSLHSYFNDYRISLEWYAPCKKLLAYINYFVDGVGVPFCDPEYINICDDILRVQEIAHTTNMAYGFNQLLK